MKTPARRKPLKTDPRRDAGDSAWNQAMLHGPGMSGIAYGMVFGSLNMVLVGLGETLLRGSISLWLLLVAFVMTCLVAAVFARKGFVQAIQFSKGAKGERAVRDALEQLRVDGYEAVHDIELSNGGKQYNIDHVLVGPGGVFAIETKYREKPKDGSPKVAYDGERVRLFSEKGGKRAYVSGWDEAPVVQARAGRDDVRRIVLERTGMDIPVRGVVVFPGWYGSDRKDYEVWVMGEKFFVGAVQRVPSGLLEAQDVKRVVAVLRDASEH